MALYPGAPAGVTASATKPRPPARPVAAAPSAGSVDWTALAQMINQPINYAALGKQADVMAAAGTADIVSGYRMDQKAILDAAAARAAQQNQAALASSRYLQGLNLGGAVASDYANSAAAQRAAAQGYSGGLQSTVNDAAAQVQANLAAAGSPQQAVNQGAAAGNALYGLGGNLPAQTLDVVGPAMAASLRALPAQTLGYGQQLAAGSLGAGQQEAAKYGLEIAKARADQAANAASYLKTLSEQALQAGDDHAANVFKILGLQQDEAAAQAAAQYHADQLASLNEYRSGQLDIATTKANNDVAYKQWYQGYLQQGLSVRDAHNAAMEKIAADNAETSRINATKPDALQVIGSDATGRSYVVGNKLVPLPGRLGKPVPGSSSGGGGLTATAQAGLVTDLRKEVKDWVTIKPPRSRKSLDGTALEYFDDQTGQWGATAPTPRVKLYSDALNDALLSVPKTMARRATAIVNSIYKPFRLRAVTAAQNGLNSGVSREDAIAGMVFSGIPQDIAEEAVKRTYVFGTGPLLGPQRPASLGR